MVLHSATHLFRNDDLTQGLRDLVDIDALLRHFGTDPHFWIALVSRSSELQLGRPLHYAVSFASRLLATPIPAGVIHAVERYAPPRLLGAVMNRLFTAALRPGAARRSTRLARAALYVRGHALRMPLPLLAWHLGVKAMRREEQAT
jgi:hypothetical protein